jgi:hypothetical protein
VPGPAVDPDGAPADFEGELTAAGADHLTREV